RPARGRWCIAWPDWAAPERCWRRTSFTLAPVTRRKRPSRSCAASTIRARCNRRSSSWHWKTSRAYGAGRTRELAACVLPRLAPSGAFALAAAAGGFVDAVVELLDALAELGDLVGERIAELVGGGLDGLLNALVELFAVLAHPRLQLLREVLRLFL